MAIQNYILTSLQLRLLERLQKVHVFASVANQEYQGEVNQLGDKVKINQISSVNINPYSKDANITIQDLDDAATELTLDQPYYFAFKKNQIEAILQKESILQAGANDAAYGFRDQADSYLAGLYAQAGLTSYASGTNPWDVTSLNAEDVLLDIQEKMARVPLEGRFLICPQWFHSKLELAGLATKTSNDQLYLNGKVDRVLGFDIMLSENVSASNTSTWEQTRIIAGVRGQSLAFVDKIISIESFRPENRFEDAVKGLYVFGGKILRPDMTCVAYCDKTAES
jgi:hypothetical protein